MKRDDYCPHGMAPNSCIACLAQRTSPTFAFQSAQNAARQLTPSGAGAGASKPKQTAAPSEFDITRIPAIMDKLKAVQGPRFMRRWFNTPAYELPKDFKIGRKDPKLLDKKYLMDDLPFDWLYGIKRVRTVIDDVIEELSEVNEFDPRVGRTKGVLDQLSPGLLVLMSRLEAMGLLDAKNKRLNEGGRSFSTVPAIELESKCQFNRVDVGTSFAEKALDELDDAYFALGSFSIKLAATELRTYKHLGYPTIEISEIGMYLRDTYDFLNVNGEDQLLGYWNETGVEKPDPFEYMIGPKRIYRWFKPFYRVTNNSFNAYRKKTGMGGDFLVYSTVKRVPVAITLHLNDADFEEYLDSKKTHG